MQRCFLRPIFVSLSITVLALLILLSGTTYAGISGVWLFDEDRGDEVLDLSGNDNHGTINGKDVHWHAGLMDEVAILDEALPEAEIKKIMQNGLQGYMAVHPKSKLSVAWGAVKGGP